jgi:two-component system sensor histidine kinase/response regulator
VALAVASLVGPILLVVYQDGRLNLNDWVSFGGSTLVSLLILIRLGHTGRQVHAYASAAQEAADRKTQFLATMSHEVRTPLNAIIGYASLLLDPRGKALTTEQRQDVQLILASSRRLLGLITELLDLARLDAARLPLTIAPVDLAEVVTEALGEVAPQARAKQIDLIVDVPAALPPLPADGQRLRQVLVNLLGNAVKFTDRGTVTVRAALVDAQLALTVADTGVGIPAAELPHIFDEYRQAATGLSRKQGGSGLGLAIAQRLVELHGGSMAVASVEGHGTTVTVRLPTRVPPPTGQADAAAP